MEFKTSSIAAGFAHSCAINSEGQLYVWGDNSNQQLREHPLHSKAHEPQNVLSEPTLIRLRYEREGGPSKSLAVQVNFDRNSKVPESEQAEKNQKAQMDANEYRAIDVACGPYSTWVVASKSERCFLNFDEPEGREILRHLRKVLLREGTLARFFELHKRDENKQAMNSGARQRSESDDGAGQDQSEQSDGMGEEEEMEILDAITAQDPFTVEVTKEDFMAYLYPNICNNKVKINSLYKQIFEQKKGRNDSGGADSLILGDIEDFALQYMQHNTKLFMFGQASKPQRHFEQEIEDKGVQSDLGDSRREGNRASKVSAAEDEDSIMVVPRPTAIKFPKFTKPLASVSCGSAHVLVLTLDQEMFSWGDGSYGALGFNSKENEYQPRRLDIHDDQGTLVRILQVSCGKFHSMCLTTRQNIYSWGEGSQGRLGHDDAQCADILFPKELSSLSQRKPIQISAGESHSAAITEQKQLFTWGNGGFGRLGHGSDTRELAPRLVDSLTNQEITAVSCGQFHTLAASKSGVVFSFGQNKYGKLGISTMNAHTGSYMEPVKISMFKTASPDLQKDKNDIFQMCAGFNHSLALARSGKAYSWGYAGKGILGRARDANTLPLPIGLGLGVGFDQQFKVDNNTFINQNLREMQMLFGGGQKEQFAKDDLQQNNGNQELGDLVDNNQKLVEEAEEAVRQVACGSVNTVALSSSGEVHVLGDNSYGQHGREDLDDRESDEEEEDDFSDNGKKGKYGKHQKVSVINFEFTSKDKIVYVACGGEHVFAQSCLDKVFGWGRSDEGQLGVGFLTEKIDKPMLVKDLSYIGVKQICCGENYSAALTMYGAVYVAGSLSGGKLGLGKGQKRGYQLNFRVIPRSDLPEIEYIACGMQHMLAIAKFSNDLDFGGLARQHNGKTFAWGKNSRGQLGIGSKENQFAPHVIGNAKERFKKVVCGYNFSLGLAHSNQLYFWGNFKYCGDQYARKDIDEPTLVPELDSFEILDIECCYKQCYFIFNKGNVKQWGKFLASKEYDLDKAQGKGAKRETKPLYMSNFPANPRFNIYFQSIAAGPNHACAIALKTNKVYVWGHNNLQNRMGLASKDAEPRAVEAPVLLAAIEDRFERKKEDLRQIQASADPDKVSEDDDEESQNGQAGDDGKDNGKFEEAKEDKDDESASESRENTDDGKASASLFEDEDSDEADRKLGSVPGKLPPELPKITSIFDIISIRESQKEQLAAQKSPSLSNCMHEVINSLCRFDHMQRKTMPVVSYKHAKKKSSLDLNIFDYREDLPVLEFIRQELHKRKEPPLIQITSKGKQSQVTASNHTLQRVIKREDEQNYDEKSIIMMDKEMGEIVWKIMSLVYSFSKMQIENKEIVERLKNSFKGRIVEAPFKINPQVGQDLKQLGQPDLSKKQKKLVENALLHLQLHPCYLVKLFKTNLLSVEDKRRIVDQLFKSSRRTNQHRLNYLLLSIFKQLLPYELSRIPVGAVDGDDDDEDAGLQKFPFIFNSNCEMISIHIFRRIFDSQMTNTDTICCIAAHIINNIMSQFVQSQGGPDASIDVTDFVRLKDNQWSSGEENEAGGHQQEGQRAGKDGRGAAADNQEAKKAKPAIEKPAAKRAQDLANFTRQIFDDIISNRVLKDQQQYFGHRKRMAEQLELVKTLYRDHLRTIQEKKAADNDFVLFGGASAQPGAKAAGQNDEFDPEQIALVLPCLRFSEEVSYMLNLIYSAMVERENFRKREELISSQILGLIFQKKIEEIESNLTINLLPYLQKSNVTFVRSYLQEVHAKNIRSAFQILNFVILGEELKPPGANGEEKAATQATAPIGILNKELLQIYSQKPELLKKILRYGNKSSSILSYKNFEHQVLHCLEQEDTSVALSTRLVGKLLGAFQESLLGGKNKKGKAHWESSADVSQMPIVQAGEASSPAPTELSLMTPVANDPMTKIIRQLSEAGDSCIREMAKVPGYQEKTRFKLRTRLFINMEYREGKKQEQQTQESLGKYVSCLTCDAILTQEIAVQNFDVSLLQSQYQPQDKQSLMAQYCDLLKLVDENPSKGANAQAQKDGRVPLDANMTEFIQAADHLAKKQQKYQLNGMISDFEKKLQIQVKNIQDKRAYAQNAKEGGRDDNVLADHEMLEWYQKRKKLKDDSQMDKRLHALMQAQRIKDVDEAVLELIREAEVKVHQRITQKFNLLVIDDEIKRHLMPQIQSRIEMFKSQLISHNKQMQQNYLFGMADRKLLCLREPYGSRLKDMPEIYNFTSEQKRSSGLQATLKKAPKQTIRGYLALPAKKLQENGTILDVRLNQLKPLIPKCDLILIESDDQQRIEFKLVYRERKKQLCGPDLVAQEHILLQFQIHVKTLKASRERIRQGQANQQSRPAKQKPAGSTSTSAPGKTGGKGTAPHGDADEPLPAEASDAGKLVFEENDALTFDPDKFFALLTQMERQKNAYAMQA